MPSPHQRDLDLASAARALDVSPTRLAVHLAHLGVDAPLLGHAVAAGDPGGVLDGLAARLERSTASVALDLADAVSGPPDGPGSPEGARGATGSGGTLLGMDLGPWREAVDARVRAAVAGEAPPPPWLVELLNPFAPRRETALDAWVRRLHRWRRGLAAAGFVVATGCLAAGAGLLLDPAATATLLSVVLPVTLLVVGFGALAGVTVASGYAAARVDRLDRLRRRLGREPGQVVREAADRVGVDDAVRRAAVRTALRIAREGPSPRSTAAGREGQTGDAPEREAEAPRP